MQSLSYAKQLESVKPSIVEIIEKYVPLRRTGKEHVGRCPFHDDKHPSFSVSDEKQVFYCFGCGESGDVIDFVMKCEGITFRKALVELGIDTANHNKVSYRSVTDHSKRRAAAKVVRWIKEQREKLNQRIRDLDEEIELADEIPDEELAESLWRERQIVADMRDDLARAEYLPDFVELKDAIEAIAGDLL